MINPFAISSEEFEVGFSSISRFANMSPALQRDLDLGREKYRLLQIRDEILIGLNARQRVSGTTNLQLWRALDALKRSDQTWWLLIAKRVGLAPDLTRLIQQYVAKNTKELITGGLFGEKA